MTIQYGPWGRDISIGGKVVGRVVQDENNSDRWYAERLISGKWIRSKEFFKSMEIAAAYLVKWPEPLTEEENKVIYRALEFYVKKYETSQLLRPTVNLAKDILSDLESGNRVLSWVVDEQLES